MAHDPADNIRRQRLASARAYVQSRFYPPLPVIYGDLAVEAVEACRAGVEDHAVVLPEDLNPLPRGYEVWYDDEVARELDSPDLMTIRAWDLVVALRIEGEVDDDY